MISRLFSKTFGNLLRCGGVRVHIATMIVDTLIALTGIALLVLLFLQSRKLFLMVSMVTLAAGIIVLRYQLHYSWTFVGKIVVDFAIPSAMAWAGVHLAAEVKEDRERHLWQAVFAMLAIFGPIIGFLVESQIDKDHRIEMADQRTNIRHDMTEAIAEYNKAHPSNPLTYEQGMQIIKLSDEHARDRKQHDNSMSGSNTYYGRFDDGTVILLAKQTATDLEAGLGEWRGGTKEIEARRDEQLYQHSVPQEERAIREKEFQDQLEGLDQQQQSKIKDVCARAEGLRHVFLERLSKKRETSITDNPKIDALFQKCATTGADGFNGRTVIEVAAHLRDLCNRIQAN